MSTEDYMWRDYDHYMHTGELSECFEEESEPIAYRRTGAYSRKHKAKTKNNEPTQRQKIENSIWYKVHKCVTVVVYVVLFLLMILGL